MADFEFRTVPQIISQTGGAAQLGQLIKDRFLAQNILIVTDAGLRKAGVLDPALASLKSAGLSFTVFDNVVADPPESLMLELGGVAKNGFDFVVGFGGGSSMDAAKLAAVLAKGEQPLSGMYGIDQITSSRLPMMMVPTTSGTGSEVTPISIVTTGETTKSGIVSPVLYADCALLDAALTVGLPKEVTAATGVDAMVHAIEAFTTKHKKNPVSDALAISALKLLSENLPKAYRNGADMDAREKCMLGAMQAGQAFANAPVAAVHALAYPLGGVFHLSHGMSNAVVLPYVLKFNFPEAKEAYAELYRQLFPASSADVEGSALRFLSMIDDICKEVGVNRQLRSFGISEDDLPGLAEDAMLQTRLLGNNPRDVTYDDALRIYQDAW